MVLQGGINNTVAELELKVSVQFLGISTIQANETGNRIIG